MTRPVSRGTGWLLKCLSVLQREPFPYVAAALPFLALTMLIWVLSADARREIDALATANSDSMQWTLAQAEVEHLTLWNAVLEAQPGDATSLREIRLRFDVFYSRMATLQSAPAFRPVRALSEVETALAHVNGFLADTIPLVDGSDAELEQSLPELLPEVAALRHDMRLVSLGGVRVFTQASERQRERVANALWDLAFLTLALFFGLFAMVLALMRLLALRRRQTEKIRQTQMRLGAVVTSSIDAVLVLDRWGQITEMNDAAEALFGYSRDEALGRQVADLILPPHLRKPGAEGWRQIPLDRDSFVDKGLVQFEATDKAGRLFPVEFSVSSAESEDGPIYVAFLRDISERVLAQEELIEARDTALAGEKAKANMLAVMSHEIRTPLNGILGSLELLSDTALSPRQTRYVEVMDRSGRMLLDHVNTVLDISRSDAGSTVLSRRPFSIDQILRDVADSLRVQADANENRIEIVPAENVGVVLGDVVRLQQVLVNLVANAVKFTKSGTITLAAFRDPDDDTVVFTVRDSGIGIPEAEHARIFDDFVTLDSSYGREVEGTGLGLGIARRLVRIMGGDISVDSRPGHGSTFRITLPLPAVEAARDPDRTLMPSGALAGEHGLRVLLVEDNETNRLVAREMLTSLGCQVCEARDGREGVEIAAQDPFDLILMDISMPHLDGVQATTLIRAQAGPNAETPIVALTAHAQPDDIERFHAAGMADVVVKPLSRGQLAVLLQDETEQGPADTSGEDGLQDLLASLARSLGPVEARETLRNGLKELEEGVADLGTYPAGPDATPALAHKLAGTAAVLCLPALHGALLRLEEAMQMADTDAAQSAIEAVRTALAKGRAEVEAALSEGTAAPG